MPKSGGICHKSARDSREPDVEENLERERRFLDRVGILGHESLWHLNQHCYTFSTSSGCSLSHMEHGAVCPWTTVTSSVDTSSASVNLADIIYVNLNCMHNTRYLNLYNIFSYNNTIVTQT